MNTLDPWAGLRTAVHQFRTAMTITSAMAAVWRSDLPQARTLLRTLTPTERAALPMAALTFLVVAQEIHAEGDTLS